jgi:serine phosphatase RsbU (regulator of sigma subunit)/anti-sigma regulatory factor (Ser/Thr protein kinase)
MPRLERYSKVIHTRSAEWGIFALLLVCIGLSSAVQISLAGEGLVRWSWFSVLIPVATGALLPFWRTLIVGAVTLATTVGIYGFAVEGISVGGRGVVITAVALAFGMSLIVCRIRLDREERLKRLMIARARLDLLSDASTCIGSTLDVTRTAQELTDVAVPQFSDFVSVDLLDSAMNGEEPAPGLFTGPVAIRRIAHASVLDGCAEDALELGESEIYSDLSPQVRSLITGRPTLAHIGNDPDFDRWIAQDPNRTARVRDYGFHSVITVPLRARGTTLGVVVFVRHQRPEPFDDDDLLLAGEVAARAAVCMDNACRYTRERATALTLQRSLLPQRIPKQAAVEAASRYLPTDSQAGVGGDWFDVIRLSGARVALVVGDVVGHGIQASATMGRLRTAVRTLADIDLPPEELLTHLDDLVVRLSEESDDGAGSDIGATCLYAVYDPVSSRCTLARAGHLAPAVVSPDGTVDFLDLPPGPPLGLGGLPFEATELELPDGSILALYTDGLVDARHRDIDEGLKDLRRALALPAPTLEAACHTVTDALLNGHPTDDVALLLARTRVLPRDQVATWDIPADPAMVGHARKLATDQLDAWGLDEAEFITELVVSELVTNAIRYGEAPIQLRLIRDRTLICEVSDAGSAAPHMRRARVFDEGGRGLLLVAQLTQDWGARQSTTGKTIWCEQALPAGSVHEQLTAT